MNITRILARQAEAAAEKVTGVVDATLGAALHTLNPGRSKRRVWVKDGRAHIEFRGARGENRDAIIAHLHESLNKVEGVHWAQVNAIVGNVVVVFDPEEGPSVDDLLEVVDDVEEAHDVEDERFPHDEPEHPADSEPITQNLLAVGADVVGLIASVVEQALSLPAIPAEIPTVVAIAENQPRVRRFFERHLGVAVADLGLGLTSAAAQALSQGPLGLVTDITHRVNILGEMTANHQTWQRREEELAEHPTDMPSEGFVHEPRPTPLPSGPIEIYSDASGIASFSAFAAILGATGSPLRATSALAAGLPKAARQGREAFAAHLGRLLAERDVVIFDRQVLRRLDRLDVLVLDSDVLLTGRLQLGAVRTFSTIDEAHVYQRASSLFDPEEPWEYRTRASLTLGTLKELTEHGIAVSDQVLAASKTLSKDRAGVLAVCRNSEIIGLVALNFELDPLAEQMGLTARQGNLEVVLAGGRKWLQTVVGAERKVQGGSNLKHSIHELQREGHGVALVTSGSAHRALRAADCGIGVEHDDRVTPWGADFITPPGLANAHFLLESIAIARDVSKRSAALALAGSTIGGMWSMLGPASSASTRAGIPVGVAALAAQVQGITTAYVLGRQPVIVPRTKTPWHTMESSSVLSSLKSSHNGLTAEEANRRQVVRKAEPIGIVRIFEAIGKELVNPLTPVLAVGAGLAAAVGSVTDAGLVAGVTAANAVIGGVQRYRAEVSIKKLLELSNTDVKVRRGGKDLFIDKERLVRGDVVYLTAGDVIAADCRIIDCEDLEVDESILTGESLPIVKTAEPVARVAVADRRCMLYEGTTISSGTATAAVVAVDDDTEIGRSLANAPKPPPSGVEARLNTLTKYTVPATIASGAVVTGLSMLRNRPVSRAVSSGVSLMVAAVPEGLPLLATVAQLASAHRLSKRGALVRNPRTIEALGRVDTLCFDKTGTLTLGEIALQRVSDGSHDAHVDTLTDPLKLVLASARRASPDPNGDGLKHLLHATDRAVVAGAVKAEIPTNLDLAGWTMVDELAFDPARGYHAVIGKSDTGIWISVKGAPEVILPRCTKWRSPNGPVAIDRAIRKQLDFEVERLAHQGYRVLAVAEREAETTRDVVDSRVAGMELLGFLGLADSVRPTAKAALKNLQSAGVNVVMITGDHPSTAKAIAEELNIMNGSRVLTGPQIDLLEDSELDEIIPEVSVFARVTPTHKVRIVGAYQRVGKVVAMTGDGANDAPAIRLANTGIALGGRGSSAAREAADLVVVDDRIETILEAIIEGRGMWVSVRDALSILVGGNLGEVGFTLASTAISGDSPLDTRQLLLVNLLTDMLPAMTIALRPPSNETPDMLLHEGPDTSLGRELIQQIGLRAVMTASSATTAWMLARMTGTTQHANTVALAALVGSQLGQTALVGGTSKTVIAASVLSGAALVAIVQTPGVSQFFGCTPLGPVGWTIAAGSTAATTGLSVALPWAYEKLHDAIEERASRPPKLMVLESPA